jgi:hypothetical protein
VHLAWVPAARGRPRCGALGGWRRRASRWCRHWCRRRRRWVFRCGRSGPRRGFCGRGLRCGGLLRLARVWRWRDGCRCVGDGARLPRGRLCRDCRRGRRGVFFVGRRCCGRRCFCGLCRRGRVVYRRAAVRLHFANSPCVPPHMRPSTPPPHTHHQAPFRTRKRWLSVLALQACAAGSRLPPTRWRN